jgi:hypothetical protein
MSKSQISASFAFVLQTLYFALLKVNNENTDDHTIKEEIKRVRALYKKIDQTMNPEKYEKKTKNTSAKVGSAKRIVSSVLSANNFYNKQSQRKHKRVKTSRKH